jgi:hypothetical protein
MNKKYAIGFSVAAFGILFFTAFQNGLVAERRIEGIEDLGNIYNLPLATENTVQLSGVNGAAFTKALTFNTSTHTLKVKIKPLSAPGGIFPYDCITVFVAVNGVFKDTVVLRVSGVSPSGQCVNAPTSQTLDYSNLMTGGPVTVTISNPQSNNCRNNPTNFGCGMTPALQNQKVALRATVQVDGTYMAP